MLRSNHTCGELGQCNDCWWSGWPRQVTSSHHINTLGSRQNYHHLADDIFKCIFFNKDIRISFQVSLKFVRKARINNIPASGLIMAWCRPGDKPCIYKPLIGPLGTNFSEIWIGILSFSFKKMHLKMSSGKWRPSCPGLNVLMPTEA